MRFGKLSRLALIGSAMALGMLLLVGACGGGDDDGDSNGGATATPAETEPSDGDDDDGGDAAPVTIDISMGDNFYEPKEITVPAGAEVTINLSNDGTAIHNMRIGGEDNELNTSDDAVSDPALMTAGQTGTVVWTAPSEPGEYIFQCDFHTTDMTGTITVE